MLIHIDKKWCLIFYSFAVFFLNSTCRSSFSHLLGISLPGMLGSINLIALLCIVVIFLLSINNDIPVMNWCLLIMMFIYAGLVVASNITSTVKTEENIGLYVLFVSILPGALLLFPSYEQVDLKFVFNKVLKIINSIYFVIFGLGIFDYFIGGKIMDFIAVYMSDATWASGIYGQNQLYGFRMYTIIGAPLFNAFYLLTLMVMNKIYVVRYKESVTNLYLVYFLSIIGIILTGSRAALIFSVAFIMFGELSGKWGIGRVLVILVVFIIIINTEIFQSTVGARLQLGFMNSSEARYSLINAMLSNSFGKPHFFIGGGYNYSRWLTSTSVASYLNFELPILMFIYDYGIVATFLYYFLFAVYPIMAMIGRRNYISAFGYLIVFLFLQTFNGTAQFYDLNMALGFLSVLFVGISDCNEKTVMIGEGLNEK